MAVFSLFMQISWTRSAATMFTSYMALANLSTAIGTRFVGTLNSVLSYDRVFVLVGILTILPLGLLFFINPEKIDELKSTSEKI